MCDQRPPDNVRVSRYPRSLAINDVSANARTRNIKRDDSEADVCELNNVPANRLLQHKITLIKHFFKHWRTEYLTAQRVPSGTKYIRGTSENRCDRSDNG